MAQRDYDASSIKVLKGLEPIKLRPSQFTRTHNPQHIIQEVLDNAIDEAQAGYAKNVTLELLPDSFVRISDDGRGIPVDLHPIEKIPAVEAIFTSMYSGGKFEKAQGGAYGVAGGLHGIGVTLTNALSLSLTATIIRDGWRYQIEFADGNLVKPLKKLERAEGSGTTVLVKPDPKYFDSPELPLDELRHLLRAKAVVLADSGLRVVFRDSREGESNTKEEVFQYTAGMAAYLAETAGGDSITPVVAGKAYATEVEDGFAVGEGAEWAFAWYEGGEGAGASFVNAIPTPDGGTHVTGLRGAIFNAIRLYIEHHSMLPKGLKLTAEDAFKSVRYVLSARMLNPSFDNQTKDRLSSREGVKLLERMAQPNIESWLAKNPEHAKNVAELVIRNAQSRTRAATKVEKKRSSSVVLLPGKLSDCESQDASITELFLVEGDSAGGSAKSARDKHFQAILPLRGKGLNSWELTALEALENTENFDISTAISVAPHTLSEPVDLSKLRYGKICILSDADVDGFHIRVLLLGYFFKHFPQLVRNGNIYIASPPLYRIDADAAGKKRPAKKIYAMDDAELRSGQDRLTKEGYVKQSVSRFKGLGEMNADQLWETTLRVETRILRQVVLPVELQQEATEMFNNLLAKNSSGWRRNWMTERGDEVEAD